MKNFQDYVIYRILRDFLILRKPALNDVFDKWNCGDEELFERLLTKSKYIQEILSKDIKIVSLGQNCLPHTLMIWNGFKLPNYINNSSRGFFDLSVTNIKSALFLLKDSKFETIEIADKIVRIGQDFYYGSDKFKLLFNHDAITCNNIELIDNIKAFNNLLKNRLKQFNNLLYRDNTLLLFNMERPENEKDLAVFAEYISYFNEKKPYNSIKSNREKISDRQFECRYFQYQKAKPIYLVQRHR